MQFSTSVLANQQVLIFSFEQAWYQEHCSELQQQLFTYLADAQCIETLSGADRESFRFEWQQQIWQLQFEYYSQSCWLEPEIAVADDVFINLQQAFTQHR